MNLNHLECFLVLADRLNFTEAAQELHLTQPSVSRQIRLFEEDLGTQLFFRDKHQVLLTPEGQELKQRLGPLMQGVRACLSTVGKEGEEVEGPLKVGCLPEMGKFFFMKAFLAFQKKNPGVDLRLLYDENDLTIQRVKSGELDFGIVTQPVISENIRSYKLVLERAVMVTRSKNKSDDDLKEATFVGFGAGDALLSEYLRKFHKSVDLGKIKRFNTVNSYRSMMDILLSQDSYAVLPRFAIEDVVRSGKLRVLGDKEVRCTHYLIHVESRFLPHTRKEFRKFLSAYCKEVDQDGMMPE